MCAVWIESNLIAFGASNVHSQYNISLTTNNVKLTLFIHSNDNKLQCQFYLQRFSFFFSFQTNIQHLLVRFSHFQAFIFIRIKVWASKAMIYLFRSLCTQHTGNQINTHQIDGNRIGFLLRIEHIIIKWKRKSWQMKHIFNLDKWMWKCCCLCCHCDHLHLMYHTNLHTANGW